MNAIAKISLMGFIAFQTMHSSEIPLMSFIARQNSYGSDKSVKSATSKTLIDEMERLNEVELRLNKLEKDFEAARSEFIEVEKQIAALNLQSK